MGRPDTDGNLAALRQEEARQERQDEAWEEIKASLEDKITEIQALAEEIQSMGEHSLYDFSEDITELIQEVI